MITTAEKYNASLHLIHNNNKPVFATLPHADNIYNIDINTRVVDAPKFLAVENDHASETIYFIIDRYVDYMDLSTTSCIITYNNAKNVSRYYIVPFYDVYTYAHADKMIIPWVLDSILTEAPGTVEFSIRFFKTGEILDKNSNTPKTVVTYNLNTIPVKSTILSGLTVG
jgi:hypothetical protein